MTDIKIVGETIPPGKRRELEIPVARLITHTLLSLPVTILNGIESGPCLWISAAIHGDEINGVEIIRRVLEQLNPQTLRGTLIAVPIVNVFGFLEQSRYLPDRRDLNRCFPGSPEGSLASRLANLFMQEIVSRCTHGIDLHTASDHRTNFPQIRANLKDEETYRCAKAFGAPVMIHATTRDGSLRQAAAKKGIPILLYEGGEALRFDSEAIRVGTQGILGVMRILGMTTFPVITPFSSVEVEKTKWVRASRGGILRLQVRLGESVVKKQILGAIANPFGKQELKIRSPLNGLVIGHTQNPLVNQGDGIIHLAASPQQ
ncbi:Succinylglutamate desuccinylase/aspartoacylase [Halothece sp. PCC 7418]|uniref:succinylglutamate desuccinylase/aspartoacylase family protein n=1 Tax=Halothece sp. (strain PCC 7418) TaxID=65093 RepID=UPI0002A07A35|nr:succinylglutamate desuccinylase/aspartoacylase family protein [Halothece sp. PCC 7418]AFZ43711.1 Succinylglutamate desuccinylase/aspartoacylase [Halothece sp. PCC 7418]